jgi:integrase
VVAEFVGVDAIKSAPATLKRRLCAIRKLHRLHGHASPVDHEVVGVALRRVLRAKRRRPQQAGALNAKLRDTLMAACPQDLRGLRDRAMIAVGYDTLCRRSELVNLLVEDVAPVTGGGAKVLVRRAKNDPFGDGRWAFLSSRAYRDLERWLDAAEIEEGPIFRPVQGDGVSDRALNAIAVSRMIKSAAVRAGLSQDRVEALSGHSMRVGAAQDLMMAGRDLMQIMTAGGWTSVDVVGRYVREADFNIWGEADR